MLKATLEEEAATKTVAVVDDDDAVRCSTGELLLAAGYETRLYANGEAFLADLEGLAVALLDVQMSGLDGISVLRQLQHRDRKPAVLVLTGHGDIALAVEAMKLGALDFLEKPYDPRDLLARVQNSIEIAEQGPTTNRVDQSAIERVSKLTPRQRDVLCGIAEGEASKVIAFKLGLSTRTVEAYRSQLLDRLGVRNTAEAVRLALLAGQGLEPMSRPSPDGL